VHARIVEGRSTLLSRCLDMQFERWPGGESVAVSHGLLRIGQAPLRVAVSTHTQDVFRLLLQMAEIRMWRQVLRHLTLCGPSSAAGIKG